MSNAEKFISDCTRNCSNEIGYCHNKTRNHNHVFYNWLTPNQARKAVEIAREEIMEKVCNLLSKMIWEITYEDLNGNSIHNYDKVEFIKCIKQAMKDE